MGFGAWPENEFWGQLQLLFWPEKPFSGLAQKSVLGPGPKMSFGASLLLKPGPKSYFGARPENAFWDWHTFDNLAWDIYLFNP